MKAVILAAGQGTRLLPLTENKPKAMVELKGKPLLQWIVERIREAGVKEAGIVVGYKQEIIRNFFGEEFEGVKIKYFEQEKHLGTANAIEVAEDFVEKEFLVLHGDIIPEKELLEKLAKKKGFDCVIVARKTSEPWKYGCLEIQGSKVKGIIEKPEKGKMKTAWINAGIYKFNRKIFDGIRKTQLSERNEFEITDSIKYLIKEGKVGCVKWSKEIIDIGDASDLERAKEILK